MSVSREGELPRLEVRVERELERMAALGETATYAELTERLDIRPPHQIRKLVLCLEALMRRDAQRSAPLLAVLCRSKVRDGLPAPGFFALASELGVYQGPESGDEARVFYDAECRRVFERYRG
jgi:hypothetical protein